MSRPGPFSAAELSADVPDYNFDIAYGLTAPLTYDIDIAQPVGSRIIELSVRRGAGRRTLRSSPSP